MTTLFATTLQSLGLTMDLVVKSTSKQGPVELVVVCARAAKFRAATKLSVVVLFGAVLSPNSDPASLGALSEYCPTMSLQIGEEGSTPVAQGSAPPARPVSTDAAPVDGITLVSAETCGLPSTPADMALPPTAFVAVTVTVYV